MQILQAVRKHILLPGYFQLILFYYIFSVEAGEDLVFSQKPFAKGLTRSSVMMKSAL